jgi:hypothetical protein
MKIIFKDHEIEIKNEILEFLITISIYPLLTLLIGITIIIMIFYIPFIILLHFILYYLSGKKIKLIEGR